MYYRHEGANLASEFSKKTGGGMVYAYDGNVGFGQAPFYLDGYYDRLSNDQTSFNDLCNKYQESRDPYGQVKYWHGIYAENGIPADMIPGLDFPNSIKLASIVGCEASL